VAMIQEAQVGVGISGREGRQAVNNSDFALPQFRFLKRLLLVHGRTDYRRVSKVVLYSFYKNIVLTITIFLFTFHSGLSGQSLYDGYLYSSYNFILALPVVGFGIFDQDLSPRMLEKYPLLYVTSREKRDMNVPIVIRMTLQAVLEGSMIFYTAYGAFTANNGSGDDGLGGDIWVFGTSVYTALIITQVRRIIVSAN
jgi:phospholipid-transporting ATPase